MLETTMVEQNKKTENIYMSLLLGRICSAPVFTPWAVFPLSSSGHVETSI